MVRLALMLVWATTLSMALTRALAQDEHWRRVRIDEGRAKLELEGFGETWSNPAEWLERAETVRAGILSAAGLEPLPERSPLNLIHRGPREHVGYTVENVALESIPGFFVTGNLYRPLNGDGPFPAVLCPHGHFQPTGDEPEGRFRSDMQKRCATLARMGAVVFAYDMVGWGESTQIEQHDHGDVLTLQLWNSMRAVDYLESLADVDSSRIGVTGASGGGTQSFLLAAVDERITCSVPVVMVSAHFFGGCRCESGRPIHQGEGYQTNNAEIAAMCAPRPQLIISCGDDWTKNTPDVELPYVQSVYDILDASDHLANAHLADEGHDYGSSKRAPMYRFMAKHLNLDLAAVTNLDGTIDESPVTIEPRELMCVFSDVALRPDATLIGLDAIMAEFNSLRGVPHEPRNTP